MHSHLFSIWLDAFSLMHLDCELLSGQILGSLKVRTNIPLIFRSFLSIIQLEATFDVYCEDFFVNIVQEPYYQSAKWNPLSLILLFTHAFPTVICQNAVEANCCRQELSHPPQLDTSYST